LGSTIWGQQFLGSRFQLAQAAQVTAVGGHIEGQFGSLFAAIVDLPSPLGVPSFAPREIESSTLASTLFTPTMPSSDILVPLSTALEPGDYALVFGGADSAVNYFPFGATGVGVMPLNNTDLPGASYFHGDAWGWAGQPSQNPGGMRFVVEGYFTMAQTFEISKYLYYLFSSREDATPVLFLYDTSGAHIAYVYFRGDSQALPQARQLPSGQYALYYRRSVLPELIDMLRNEKPIYLHWVPQGTNNTRISTTVELVGEGEG
jgi:hypothetical protein